MSAKGRESGNISKALLFQLERSDTIPFHGMRA